MKYQRSFDDMETWLRSIVRYESRPENPRNRFSKIVRKVTGISSEVKIYEKAFTPKALDDLYSLRSPSCSLVILKVDESGRNGSGSMKISVTELLTIYMDGLLFLDIRIRQR